MNIFQVSVWCRGMVFSCKKTNNESTRPIDLTDMIIRLIEETSRTDDAWVMFRAMESDSASVEQLLNVGVIVAVRLVPGTRI